MSGYPYVPVIYRDQHGRADLVAIHNRRRQLDAFEDVLAFHAKFELPRPNAPQLLDSHLYEYRLKFLREELAEFETAHAAGDIAKATDALLDLIYVAYGTAIMMGLRRVWAQCWGFVQNANLMKVRVAAAAESKRGSAFDVRKPSGWSSPDAAISAAIEELRRGQP